MDKPIEELFSRYICRKCGNTKFRPVAGTGSERGNAFLFQCMVCNEHDTFIYLTRPVSTQDRIINIVNSLSDFETQMQSKMEITCSKCKQGRTFVDKISMSNRMRLDVIECDNCHFSMPVISIPLDILAAYCHDMELAQKVVKDYPEIALVFCISALETYFRQLFKYNSQLNGYLVEKRRVSFQYLPETKEILDKEFGINIARLIKKDWPFLSEKFKQRNCIIHNASHTADGKRIKLTQKEINRLFSIADDLVLKIEMALLSPQILNSDSSS